MICRYCYEAFPLTYCRHSSHCDAAHLPNKEPPGDEWPVYMRSRLLSYCSIPLKVLESTGITRDFPSFCLREDTFSTGWGRAGASEGRVISKLFYKLWRFKPVEGHSFFLAKNNYSMLLSWLLFFSAELYCLPGCKKEILDQHQQWTGSQVFVYPCYYGYMANTTVSPWDLSWRQGGWHNPDHIYTDLQEKYLHC